MTDTAELEKIKQGVGGLIDANVLSDSLLSAPFSLKARSGARLVDSRPNQRDSQWSTAASDCQNAESEQCNPL